MNEINQFISQNIITKFKQFEAKMKDNLQEYIMLNKAMREYNLEDISYPSIYTGELIYCKAAFYSGKKSHFIDFKNSKLHFIEAITMFENYINYLAEINFNNFPRKLGNSPLESSKLMTLIYEYEHSDDIIEKIIEEKVRSIFYGNPKNIFLKDPCKFELKNYFIDTYKVEITYFSNIVARRNAIIHNNSRVDTKFLKECENSNYIINDKIIISEDYLLATISLLVGLAGEVTSVYLENVYRCTPRKSSILYQSTKKFRTLCRAGNLLKVL